MGKNIKQYAQNIFKHEYEVAMKLTSQQNAFFQLTSLEAETLTNRVKLDSDQKYKFIEKIGSKTKNPVNLANRIIENLIKKDVMRRVERGVYMLNPRYRDKQNTKFSYAKFTTEYDALAPPKVDKSKLKKKSNIYPLPTRVVG